MKRYLIPILSIIIRFNLFEINIPSYVKITIFNLGDKDIGYINFKHKYQNPFITPEGLSTPSGSNIGVKLIDALKSPLLT